MYPIPLVVGCVADQPHQLLEQAWRLLVSWRANAGRLRDAPFVLCVAGGVPPDFARRVAPYKAQLVAVEPLTPTHPPSNKLRWFQPAGELSAERYVLLDCDTWVCQEPTELLGPEPLRAKLADMATVTDAVFDRVFATAGIAKPPAQYRLPLNAETSIAYFNAGVLSFSRAALDVLVPRWLYWNAWLEERMALLETCQGFLEQASLSVAIAELGWMPGLLDEALNFPGHFKDLPQPALENIDPVILHYHKEYSPNGMLAPTPLPLVQKRIDDANTELFTAWRDLAMQLSMPQNVECSRSTEDESPGTKFLTIARLLQRVRRQVF